MPIVYALLAGVLFGAGLTISDMVNPARVQNFLDIAGTWDPTLVFVMGGALAVALPGYRLVLGRTAPLSAATFHLPAARDIDRRLIGGAALFGVGWGLAGICPGPAFADIVTFAPGVFVFIAAMLAAMLLARAARRAT
jgi:uncharacterized membrane protein YedE/YeeE